MDSFYEYLNKLVNSSLPSYQKKSLEENIYFLKKNLFTKDEIIKKQTDSQSTVLNCINIQILKIKLALLYPLTVLT